MGIARPAGCLPRGGLPQGVGCPRGWAEAGPGGPLRSLRLGELSSALPTTAAFLGLAWALAAVGLGGGQRGARPGESPAQLGRAPGFLFDGGCHLPCSPSVPDATPTRTAATLDSFFTRPMSRHAAVPLSRLRKPSVVGGPKAGQD